MYRPTASDMDDAGAGQRSQVQGAVVVVAPPNTVVNVAWTGSQQGIMSLSYCSDKVVTMARNIAGRTGHLKLQGEGEKN